MITTMEAIYTRRAVRSYTREPISEATVKELIDAAIHAPSAINSQPWAFVVVQDQSLLDEISKRTMELMKGQTFPPELQAMFDQPDWSIFYHCPTLIVICARPDGEHPDWDCCFAAENLMLAAREMGLGSCIIGFAWMALADPDIKKRLNIPENYKAIAPIIVGHTPEFPPPTGRKAPEILSWKVPATTSP